MSRRYAPQHNHTETLEKSLLLYTCCSLRMQRHWELALGLPLRFRPCLQLYHKICLRHMTHQVPDLFHLSNHRCASLTFNSGSISACPISGYSSETATWTCANLVLMIETMRANTIHLAHRDPSQEWVTASYSVHVVSNPNEIDHLRIAGCDLAHTGPWGSPTEWRKPQNGRLYVNCHFHIQCWTRIQEEEISPVGAGDRSLYCIFLSLQCWLHWLQRHDLCTAVLCRPASSALCEPLSEENIVWKGVLLGEIALIRIWPLSPWHMHYDFLTLASARVLLGPLDNRILLIASSISCNRGWLSCPDQSLPVHIPCRLLVFIVSSGWNSLPQPTSKLLLDNFWAWKFSRCSAPWYPLLNGAETWVFIQGVQWRCCYQ